MKQLFIFLLFGTISVVVNSEFTIENNNENPFLKEYETPFGVPPFDDIKEEYYLPAFKEGIKENQKEINAIIRNSEDPAFNNTIEALEISGRLISRVGYVFYNLLSSHSNERMRKISEEAAPLLSKNSDDIIFNENLFERIKTVYNEKEKLNLTVEQSKLLEETYKDFVRNGANLNEEQKEKLRKINEELSVLTLKFSDNILKETNAYKLVIENKIDLDGLPESVIQNAKEEAEESGYKGKWIFTLHKPSFIPFLQYSSKRDLREKIFKAYINRADNNNNNDNKNFIKKIVALRIEKAKLLGYKTHADYKLEKTMAKTPESVYKLLELLWKAALPVAKKEASELQDMIYRQGDSFKLEPWDWWYYAEKLRKEKYDLNEEDLRPYFRLDNVREGAFSVASKLYGVSFTEINDIPKYHPDVRVFEVKDSDNSHISILYTDFFPRESKRAGAWMDEFRKQCGKFNETPVICNVGNFTKPAGDIPSLLNYDEVETLFHEFGHALHGLLSKCEYESLSGTSVPRDFVELPSQIMENWAIQPEVLKSFALHYKTGEPIPDELIEKIKKSSNFNQGFATIEYLAASFLDMDYHTLTETDDFDVNDFENNSMIKIGMIPEIVVRYRSTYFNHIFNNGYDAGYYSYIYAEVLDADAFEAFKANGLFDKKTAQSFRQNILEKGGTEDPMVLYKRFRGAEPTIEPLLKKRGLKAF
ncbi:MAG: M3 family metallopeptidase [Ignavibacteriaceae bacterium]